MTPSNRLAKSSSSSVFGSTEPFPPAFYPEFLPRGIEIRVVHDDARLEKDEFCVHVVPEVHDLPAPALKAHLISGRHQPLAAIPGANARLLTVFIDKQEVVEHKRGV